MIAGVVTGYGAADALFLIGAPCMSGGSGGAMTTLPALYSNLSGTDMTPLRDSSSVTPLSPMSWQWFSQPWEAR